MYVEDEERSKFSLTCSQLYTVYRLRNWHVCVRVRCVCVCVLHQLKMFHLQLVKSSTHTPTHYIHAHGPVLNNIAVFLWGSQEPNLSLCPPYH